MKRMRQAGAALRRLGRCDEGVAAVEFALVAPLLMLLTFAVIVYSLYFAAYLGVRQAASEGARAAMAGLSTTERSNLAIARATQVIQGYGSLVGATATPIVTAGAQGTGLFQVSVTFDISTSSFWTFRSFVPLPSDPKLNSTVIVANGSY